MGMNAAPSGERLHIAVFGSCNVGKSSLVNAITGQAVSIVSPVKGTTSDPVRKSMELAQLGPVVLIDTPGLDDDGEIGSLRSSRAMRVMDEADAAILVADAARGTTALDDEVRRALKDRGTPCITAYNRCDLLVERPPLPDGCIYVSALTGENVGLLIDALIALRPKRAERTIVADLLRGDAPVMLVMPIDSSAPRGRVILPQQQVIRELLDAHVTVVCCQPEDIERSLSGLVTPPQLAVTDSQAFAAADASVPREIPLTSFSILFARYKGDLAQLVEGAAAMSRLRDGDRVLIAEGCTHRRQCEDIGTVKLPRWIREHTHASPAFEFASGGELGDLSGVKLVVHCGGCMLNAAEMSSRLSRARAAGVPIVNYGAAIAHAHGLLRRALAPFPDAIEILG